MKTRLICRLIGLGMVAHLSTLFAQNTTFTYQGRITDNGTNFTGIGQFEFALVSSTNASAPATATAVLFSGPGGGTVSSITVNNGGAGYLSAPAVAISGGGGSGAMATAYLTAGGSSVAFIQVNNPGSGYVTAPTVTLAPPPANIVSTTDWDNDGAPNGIPQAGVPVPVTNGLFTVVLGDTTESNMTALSASLFVIPNLQLRIWFNDGAHGFAALSPPQVLTPAPYAAFAGTASTLTGAISAAQLPAGAVTNNQSGVALSGTFSGNGSGLAALNPASLSPGTAGINITGSSSNSAFANAAMSAAIAGSVSNASIAAAQLNTTGSPANGQVLGYNGGSLVWLNPASAAGGWGLTGNSGTVAGTDFIGTTDGAELVFKSHNKEGLRLTTGQNLILQRPSQYADFSERNGLGVFGYTTDIDQGYQVFANQNVLGPVLFGESGGGLGIVSATGQQTLALQWSASGISLNEPATINGSTTITGSLGIGTTTPQAPLAVNGGVIVDSAGLNNGTPMANLLTFGGSTGEGIGSIRANGYVDHDGLNFYTDGVKRLTILNNGYVGIGTNAPQQTLDVNGTAHFSGDASYDGSIMATNGTVAASGLDADYLLAGGALIQHQLTVGDTSGSAYFQYQTFSFEVLTSGNQPGIIKTADLRVESDLDVSGSVNSSSSRFLKTDFAPADTAATLARVVALPIQTWRFTNEVASLRHLGPMSQDFFKSFGLGKSDTSIATVDEAGVALAAIQGLNEKLEAENVELKTRLAKLEQLVTAKLGSAK